MVKILKTIVLLMFLLAIGRTARAQDVQAAYADGEYRSDGSGPLGTLASIIFPSNLTAGNTIIVHVGCGTRDYTCNLSPPTDDEGNLYTSIVPQCTAASGTKVQGWTYIATNIPGGTKGHIQTVGSASGFGGVQYIAWEINGYNAVDQVGCATGLATSNVTVSSPSVTTTHAAELLLGLGTAVYGVSANFTAAGSGYTENSSFSVGSQVAEYKVVGSTGAYTATAALQGNTDQSWEFTIVTLYHSVAPTPPVISSSLVSMGTTGTAYSYNITATNAPTSYSASGLPSALTINTSTGAITGTPASMGTSNVTIGAHNASGTTTATLVLTVSTPPAVDIWSAGYYFPQALNGLPGLGTIDWTKLTHIIFVAGNINNDGTITDTGDFNALSTPLITAAHAHNVKVIYGLGCNTNVNNHECKDAVGSHLSTLISNITSHINSNGNFDGFDNDDEEDWDNTTELNFGAALQTAFPTKQLIRTATDAYFSWQGGSLPNAPIPVCAGAHAQGSNGLTLAAANYYARISLLSYDIGNMNGSLPESWFNTPLYSPPGVYLYSVDYLRRAVEDCGISSTKLNIGIPFYAYEYQSTANGPYQAFGGSPVNAQFGYNAIMNSFGATKAVNTIQDPLAQSPWFNVDSTHYVSYNTPASVLQLAQYARAENLGGWVIWILGWDYDPSFQPNNDPLLNAIPTLKCDVDPLGLACMPTMDEDPNDYQSNVWLTDSMVKVQQQSGSPGSLKTYQGYFSRNEWADFQVHVQGVGGSTNNINVVLGNISKTTGPGASYTICGSTTTAGCHGVLAQIEATVYYNVTVKSDLDPLSVTGWQPDGLIPKKDPYYGQTTNAFPAAVTSGQNQSFFAEYYITADAPPGYYCGNVTVSSTGGATFSETHPICINVWSFNLPTIPTLTSFYSSDRSAAGAAYYGNGSESAGYTNSNVFPTAGGSSETAKSKMNLAFAVIMADHRISASESNYPWPNSGAGNDWTNFDRYFGPILKGITSTTDINPLTPGASLRNWDYNVNNGVSSGGITHSGYTDNIFNWMQHAAAMGYPPPYENICDEVVCTFTTNLVGIGNTNYLKARANPYNCTNGGSGAAATFEVSTGNQITYAGCSAIPMRVLATKGVPELTSLGILPYVNMSSPNIYTVYPVGGPDTKSTYLTWVGLNSPAPGATWILYGACSFAHYSFSCNYPPVTNPTYPGPAIDATPVRNRATQSIEYLEGATGDLYYETGFCLHNPTQCAGADGQTISYDPWHSRYYSGVHGDGTVLYPCTYSVVGTGSPVSWSPFPCASFELKMMRKGFSDYEYEIALKNAGWGTFVGQALSQYIVNPYTFSQTPQFMEYSKILMGNALHTMGLGPASPPPVLPPGAPRGIMIMLD